MKKPIVVAVIPVRKNSKRLKNKNFLNFFRGKSLLELKIDQLKKVKLIDKIVVSSDSLKAKKIAKKHNVFFHNRKKYYASSSCSGSNFFNKLDVPHKFDATKLAPPVNSPNLFIKSILFILVFIYKVINKF